MTFKQILSRLTGISCPVFGIQWNPPEPEITVAQRVISFLEDRRVLYNPFDLEFFGHYAPPFVLNENKNNRLLRWTPLSRQKIRLFMLHFGVLKSV